MVAATAASLSKLVRLGKTGRMISPVGFGCYRIHEGDEAHHAALTKALLSGCNVIDTSTNYGDGESEKLVGRVLRELSNRMRREDVTLVTKVGYVQGSNMKLVRDREKSGQPFTDVVKFSPDCWHCISPDFLEDQIAHSLARLGVSKVDVLLLHNPEYFLKAEGDHAAYYQRIEKAFVHLEKEIARGRIATYGISSNTFPSAKEEDDYTSLETVLEIADRVGGKGFAVIQFPMNLYEPGAAFEKNNSGQTILELARARDIGTLVNRPLNAFGEKGLIRLADFPAHDDRNIADDLKAAWNRAMELEMEYPKLLPDEVVPATRIAWGHILRQNFEKIAEVDAWKSLLKRRIEPELAEALEVLGQEPKLAAWVKEYRVVTEHLFDAFTAYVENQASHRSDKIAGALDHVSHDLRTSKTLSQKVVRAYLSVPGIDCVLVGMRHPDYVDDMLVPMPAIAPDAALRCFEAAAHVEL